MNENNKNPLILFSGGIDSTYLLEMMLKKGPVETIYVKALIDERKLTEEMDRRKKIIHYLEDKTGNTVVADHVINIGEQIFHGEMADAALIQPLMWLNGALHVSNKEKHSELLIGYVAGDDATRFLNDMELAWLYLQRVCKGSGEIPVGFPLKNLPKSWIIHNYDHELMRLTWWCETPKPNTVTDGNRRCGKCGSCINMKVAFYRWSLDHNGDKYHRHVLDYRTSYQTRKNKVNGCTKSICS